ATIAGHSGALPAAAGLIAGALIGFADDRSKLRVGTRGIPARLKFPLQLLLAVPVAWLATVQGGPQLFLPVTPWLVFPLAVLAIGFALAAMAIQQGILLLLPIVGLVFVLETLSVIIQVAYFKASGGRRVFTMTPIHYTFHHEGWSENRIALSFWGAGLISALA